ncbi:MAG: TetR/AcrR family transcriptional regulator [Magnetospirillum sp.]|nr:TetR/AcrR family transcriptional regulator [Magnetospirillum sp.]
MVENCSDKKCARDRILAAAEELFYREGIRAVGIDTVIETAGVAKMSLYRAFPSKDDLVAAYLEDLDRRYWLWWDEVTGRHPGDPRAQLLAVFQALAKFTRGANYRGCAFINTAVEFHDPAHPGHAVAEAHKREVRRRLCRLAAAAGAPQPEVLADQLQLLMEGAYSAGNTMGQDSPAAAVVGAAKVLIDATLNQGNAS